MMNKIYGTVENRDEIKKGSSPMLNLCEPHRHTTPFSGELMECGSPIFGAQFLLVEIGEIQMGKIPFKGWSYKEDDFIKGHITFGCWGIDLTIEYERNHQFDLFNTWGVRLMSYLSKKEY